MNTVRVYYAGIPAKNTKQEKTDVLHNFHLGIDSPDQSKEVYKAEWQPADLAVLQGWVHANSGNSPHLQFRKQVIAEQQRIGKHTLAIDSNLFLYKDKKNINQYLRFSLNDVFPTTGTYFTEHVDPCRWLKIKDDLGISLKPRQHKGKHVLICLQRNGGWSMGDLDVMTWCADTIRNLKKYTDRPIVVRAHPGDKQVKNYLKLSFPGVKISKNIDIEEDFSKAWATVTYNSSPGVASAIEGIPVFVTDPVPQKSQAYDVANTDLTQIENPVLPDRQSWIEKIAMCHFNFDDLRRGVAWNIIKDHL